jgi:hypothetical protein
MSRLMEEDIHIYTHHGSDKLGSCPVRTHINYGSERKEEKENLGYNTAII